MGFVVQWPNATRASQQKNKNRTITGRVGVAPNNAVVYRTVPPTLGANIATN